MPERETTPTLPFLKMLPGNDADLAFVGGQHAGGSSGPISRDFEPDSARFTLTMSSTGMAFGDRNDQLDLGIDRLEDRIGRERRRAHR